MKKTAYSLFSSAIATGIVIMAIVFLGTQTQVEIYSSNIVLNCTLLFIIFSVASAGVEIFQEIGTLDPIIDFVFDMTVAIITTYRYYQQGILLFDGLTPFKSLLRYLFFPLIIVVAVSFMNFTSKVEKLKND